MDEPVDESAPIEAAPPVLLVTVQDIKSIQFCNRGTRNFFERHGLDWSAFVTQGIDADLLRATGDHMALEVVQAAERRVNSGQQ